jgi:hypothetical protein
MKQNKKAILLILLVAGCKIYANGDSNKVKFIKGNIVDKIAAVRDASGIEARDLSLEAVSFVIENKNMLSDDRDLAALAVAGVFAFPDDYISSLTQEDKQKIVNDMTIIFNTFSDNTVKIAVLKKMTLLNGILPEDTFVVELNNYIKNTVSESTDIAVIKTATIALGVLGNNQSFLLLYDCLQQNKFPSLTVDIQNSLAQLADRAIPDILGIIQKGDVRTIRPLFDTIEKSEKNTVSIKAEIAENVLSETIYIAGNSLAVNEEIISLQMDSLRVLAKSNWTRSSSVVISFFDQAVIEYKSSDLNEDDFMEVIIDISNLSPVDASQKLSAYLTELNKQMENNKDIPEKIVRTVITTLGMIGNKSAFDALLAVTYLNYPDDIITAARDSLAKLKW